MEQIGAIWSVIAPGNYGNPIREVPLMASLLYYGLAIAVGSSLRAFVKLRVNRRWQPYMLDAATTFMILACSLENGQIRRFYGVWAYLVVLFMSMMVFTLTVKEGSANPCAHVLVYMKGLQTARHSILRVMFQLVGGLMSYKFARQVWSLGLHAGHTERYAQLFCVSDMTVPTHIGFAVEFSATLLDTTLCLVTMTSFWLCETAIKILLTCYLVIIGVHLTGMYMNPINATNQTFGCKGKSIPEFVLVYWLGPILATVTAYKLNQWMQWGKPTQDSQSGDSNGEMSRIIRENNLSKIKGVRTNGLNGYVHHNGIKQRAVNHNGVHHGDE